MTEADYFKQQARQCRSVAAETPDRDDQRALLQLARHYDGQAARLEKPRLHQPSW